MSSERWNYEIQSRKTYSSSLELEALASTAYGGSEAPCFLEFYQRRGWTLHSVIAPEVMRFHSLHNALYVAAKLLRADMIAVRLSSADHLDWPPADVVVGETQLLENLDWPTDNQAPNFDPEYTSQHSLFGVDSALTLCANPASNALVAGTTINETVLDALPGQFLLHDRRAGSRLSLGQVWFAIALDPTAEARSTLLDPEANQPILELILGVCAQTLWSVYHGAMLQLDPVTALPGPAELRHRLQLTIAQAKATDETIGLQGGEATQTLLALIEIDNLALLRRHLGASETQALITGAADALRSALRTKDGLFRYSDSAFAVTADITDGAATKVIEKLMSAWQGFTRAERFSGVTLSVGYSASEASTPGASQLLLAVEQATEQARRLTGSQTVEASLDQQLDLLGQSQPAGGVFTNDPLTDYRNSRVLWHVTSLIATATQPDLLCVEFSRLLQDMLSLPTAEIFTEENAELRHAEPGSRRALSEDHKQLLHQAIDSGELQSDTTEQRANSGSNRQAIAVPLVSRNQSVGALLIESYEPLDDSDLMFLKAIADQIAGALDRLELAQRQEVLNGRESASLRAEVQELRDSKTTNTKNTLVAVSQAMCSVLDYVKKIAPTDASVLIMGESGAGKEVMAKAIVAASNRASKPLITVDCSAIAHSLIDSELFGRVKGAFTGADDASPGRIAQADGGTLFLDEIGELPMDVQAKLLRFVQEKELIAVGDTRRQKIDTRIICATNRDLLHESGQGRFRSDLYYRLQVLQVTVPPLRERLADIPGLATSFVERYAEQFGKTIDGFTDAAWLKINQYSWPGNVRELQNAIVRATLTAENNYIDELDLQFGDELPAPEPSVQHGITGNDGTQIRAGNVAGANTDWAPDSESEIGSQPTLNSAQNSADDWETLASLLAGQVVALLNESRLEAPLGRWLSDTVVLTAAKVSDGVARQAARLLGVPETTLRRQLNKARQNQDNPFQLMSPQWLTSLPALTDLLHRLMISEQEETDFADRCQALLLQQVADQIGNDRKVGAALMGITPPTYARWLEKYSVEPQPLIQPGVTTRFKLEQKYS